MYQMASKLIGNLSHSTISPPTLATSLSTAGPPAIVRQWIRNVARLVLVGALLSTVAAPEQVGAQTGLDPKCERYATLVQQLVTRTFGVGSPESEATFGMIKAVITALDRSKTGAFTAEEQAAIKRFVAVSAAAQDEVLRGLERGQAKLRGKSENERRRLMEAGLAAEMKGYLGREEALKFALKTVVVCMGGR
jgi:hypothetical protein